MIWAWWIMVKSAANPRTWEAETRGLEVQHYLHLCMEFETSLGCKRPCLTHIHTRTHARTRAQQILSLLLVLLSLGSRKPLASPKPWSSYVWTGATCPVSSGKGGFEGGALPAQTSLGQVSQCIGTPGRGACCFQRWK